MCTLLFSGILLQFLSCGYLKESEMISTIVSGGQTGVDQAALFVGTKMGIQVGGWCPLGGLDENNESILEKYPLTEVTGFSFEDSIAERNKRNIEDTDGTLIIVPSIPLPESIKDGTLLTIKHAEEKQKPHIMVSVSDSKSVDAIRNWIRESGVKVLNVAGPRESSSPGIYEQSCRLLRQLFSIGNNRQ